MWFKLCARGQILFVKIAYKQLPPCKFFSERSMQLSAVPLHSKGSPNMVHSFGIRKGAWTKDEDVLLRKCIEKYGEGNWRQVPLKAGLNRCRKSCRLRWLNYLHPNIKRGEFAADEVDLIIRMHKLLGNRWSLIAGRLMGRTANDVKNYWNTHLHKKVIRSQSEVRVTYKTQVIKPHPRTFSRTSQWLRRNKLSEQTMTCKDLSNNKSPVSEVENKEEKSWWETLLFDNNEEIDYSCSVSRSEEQIIPNSFCVNGVESKTGGGTISKSTICKSYWDDMYLDVNVWDLLMPEEEQVM